LDRREDDGSNGNDREGSESPQRPRRQPIVQAVPVSLVPSKDDSQDERTPGGSDETLNAILVEPLVSPSKSQKLYKNQANSILEEDENEDEDDHRDDRDHENGTASPKEKLVKEGAYLKSRLWWFGLLLIATGEGGRCPAVGLVRTKAKEQVISYRMDLRPQV
jgi:hypothetical protein